MKISIVIPCFNENNTIGIILQRILECALELEKEIIIVDDFSTDGTRDTLKEMQKKNPGTKIIYHDHNQGKGAALRTGFDAATGDILIVQDADLEYSPSDYPRLLKPILDEVADVVYGSRFIGGESHRVLYFWHSIGNKFLTLLSNMFTNLNLTDMEVCYKVFKREALSRIELTENRFGFEPEFTAKISRQGLRIYEVGISYAGRTYREGKKVGWRDGVRAAYAIIKYNCFR